MRGDFTEAGRMQSVEKREKKKESVWEKWLISNLLEGVHCHPLRWIETVAEKPRVILYVGGLALALFAIVYFARVPDYTFICWFTASPRLFLRPGYEKLHIEKTSRLIVATKIERRLTYALYEPPPSLFPFPVKRAKLSLQILYSRWIHLSQVYSWKNVLFSRISFISSLNFMIYCTRFSAEDVYTLNCWKI